MKVLVVSNMFPSTANPQFGSFVQNLHAAIQRTTGVECVYAVNRTYRKGRWINLWKYTVHLGRTLLQAWRHRRDIRLLHVHYILPPGLFAWLLKRLCGWPMLITVHGGDVNLLLQKGGLVPRLHRVVVTAADRLNPVSRDIRDKLLRLYDLPANRFFVQNMGVDDTVFRRLPDARGHAGLLAGQRLLLFVGNLIPRKAPDFFVEVFLKLAERHPELVGAVIGDGPLRSTLERSSAAVALGGRLRWPGRLRQPEIAAWLSAADLVIFPSRQEPLGLVAIEAMACGAPVIASRVGGIPEIIDDGKNGLLFGVDDLDGALRQAEQVLNSTALAQRLIEAGYVTAQTNALSKVAGAFAEQYAQLIDGVSQRRTA